MENKVIMYTSRTGYSTDQVRHTMTVGELIDCLSQFDADAKIFTAHDNGYTFGGIGWSDFTDDFDEDGNPQR